MREVIDELMQWWESGETVGLGTHEQLLATCPTYAEIVESQIGEGAAA